MRHASLVSVILFILASTWLTPIYGNTARWFSFIGYVVVRALTQDFYSPNIRRNIGTEAA